MKRILSFLVTSHLCMNIFSSDSFVQQWHQMQNLYEKANTECNKINRSDYLHPFWEETKESIKSLINGAPDKDFLQFNVIKGTMVCQGINIPQEYELCYLNYCISNNTKTIIRAFNESSFARLPVECPTFNCSSNCLTHLF